MSAAHTPGPWKIDIGHRSKQARGISALTRNIVNFNGLASPASAESAANAKLISAAPELLAALQQVQEYIIAMKGRGHQFSLDIEAAIDKATKEQP